MTAEPFWCGSENCRPPRDVAEQAEALEDVKAIGDYIARRVVDELRPGELPECTREVVSALHPGRYQVWVNGYAGQLLIWVDVKPDSGTVRLSAEILGRQEWETTLRLPGPAERAECGYFHVPA